MNRKSKLFFSLVSLCFSIAVLCFGVYSALSVSYSVSGSVSYEIQDVFVELDLSVYRALSTTPVNSATHKQNVSTIKDAGDNISETDFGKLSYTDHKSTYENGVVTNPGQEWSVSSPDLDLTYGSPTNDNQGYAFYIVIDIHNLGSEIINAQITAPTSLENTILRDSGNVEITADGTERIVLGLALDDVTKGITSADFTYTIIISRGELPEVEAITDMTFSLDEVTKTATLTSYTGSDTIVEIPETIGVGKQTTKTLGLYANVNALITEFSSSESGLLDVYLVGDISYTSGNEQKVDENQMIALWAMNNENAEYTNIKIECKDSYTLTVSASDVENEVGMVMLYGPAAGYILAGDQTILDTLNLSYTVHLNNQEFYIDKNAVMQAMESNSGNFMDYIDSVGQLIETGIAEITISFKDIVYGYGATKGDEYTVTNIGDEFWTSNADSFDDLAIFPSIVESISLPSTVTYIQYHAFEGTQWLENLRVQEGYNGIITSKDGILKYFIETPQNAELTEQYVNSILEGVQVIGEFAFAGSDLSGNIVIPNTVKRIDFSAFLQTSINTLTFENNSQLVSIGGSSFNNCESLTSITIPSSVTSIGAGAFFNCIALKTVTFENNSQLKSIKDNAFSYCNSLTSIEIPSGVTSMGGSTFEECKNLKTVTFGESSQLKSIENLAFFHCESLISINIPSSVTSIGDSAFYYCYSLTSITIPSSVTSIGTHAFDSCSALTSIEIPSSVTSIGMYAFSSCYALETVTFEDADSVWVISDTSNTEIKISEHTVQELATYLKNTYDIYTWTKKQSA